MITDKQLRDKGFYYQWNKLMYYPSGSRMAMDDSCYAVREGSFICIKGVFTGQEIIKWNGNDIKLEEIKMIMEVCKWLSFLDTWHSGDFEDLKSYPEDLKGILQKRVLNKVESI